MTLWAKILNSLKDMDPTALVWLLKRDLICFKLKKKNMRLLALLGPAFS